MFYGELNGNFLVASSDETGERYQVNRVETRWIVAFYFLISYLTLQVSWSESNKKARTGEIRLRLYDDEGYGAAKKAQRNNEELSKVKELTTISFYHKVRSQPTEISNRMNCLVLKSFK